jgi:anion-transporting  ArsA/GET3 family ATPase
VEKRLTKAFFQKHYALSTSEKKFLSNKIESMKWLGMITPANANINSVKTDHYDYSLINIFVISLHAKEVEADGKKAIELLQKYLPDQALVIAETEFDFMIGSCDKRINQADKNKRTIESCQITSPLSKLYKKEVHNSFFERMSFEQLDTSTLESTYKSYINAIVQLNAAKITGTYRKRPAQRSQEDMKLLEKIENRENDIAQLRSQIKKESQLNAQVKINVAIQEIKKELEDIKKELSK